MVTYNSGNELRGLSTDTKPSPVRNGTIFTEMDTGSMFIYDEENGEWIDYIAAGDGVEY